MKAKSIIPLFFGLALLVCGNPAHAFPQCGEQACEDCHMLTREEAKELVGPTFDAVQEINFSEVKGLWEVVVEKGGKRFPVYIDFAKSHAVSGEIIRLGTMESVTQRRFIALNKIDVARIPLADALVLGSPDAPRRLIVFEDPECPFCHKLYLEMKNVVAQRPDIAFYIKMFPLKIHPTAYNKAKTIICERSLQLLEDSLAGKALPPPECKTDQIEKNTDLAGQLGITSTPTVVYPDGMVVPGFLPANKILEYLDEALASMPEKK